MNFWMAIALWLLAQAIFTAVRVVATNTYEPTVNKFVDVVLVFFVIVFTMPYIALMHLIVWLGKKFNIKEWTWNQET